MTKTEIFGWICILGSLLYAIFFSGATNADARIDSLNGQIHVPYSVDETQRETQIFLPRIEVIQQAPFVDSYQRIENIRVLCWRLPPELQGLDVGTQVIVKGEDTAEDCEITDALGVTRKTPKWVARHALQTPCPGAALMWVSIQCEAAQ